MKPLTVFQHNFAAAENLIHLYDLLSGPNADDGKTKAALEAAKGQLDILEGEQVFCLRNDRMFLVAREAAQVSANFFHEHNLASLLRQAVVAACSALDAYFNDKFREKCVDSFIGKETIRPHETQRITNVLR